MFLPRPGSLWLAKSWFMKSSSEKPRCLNIPVSLYCANTTSSGFKALAEPTAIPSSPAETLFYLISPRDF